MTILAPELTFALAASAAAALMVRAALEKRRLVVKRRACPSCGRHFHGRVCPWCTGRR